MTTATTGTSRRPWTLRRRASSTTGPVTGPSAAPSRPSPATLLNPALVAGCRECLELVAEDLGDDNEHWAHCLHCQQEISAQNGVEWRRMVRQPCPHCGKAAW